MKVSRLRKIVSAKNAEQKLREIDQNKIEAVKKDVIQKVENYMSSNIDIVKNISSTEIFDSFFNQIQPADLEMSLTANVKITEKQVYNEFETIRMILKTILGDLKYYIDDFSKKLIQDN